MDVLLIVQRMIELAVVAVFAAALVRFLGWDLPKMIARGSTDTAADEGDELRPDRISFVDGLPEDGALQGTLEETLDWVVAAAPPGRETAACACIRKDGDEYVGVVRVDSKRCHYVRTIRGGSHREVALGIIEKCAGSQGTPRGRRKALETDGCNRDSCPSGGYYSLVPPPPE